MEFFRILASRCGAMFQRKKLDADLDEELQCHLELAIEENMLRGMNEEEAYTAALRKFGGVTQVKERYRARRGLPSFDEAWQDIRFAFRQLVSHPGFALTTILSLGLGIGATVSVFSITYAVLVNPYPYAGSERILLPDVRDRAGYLSWPNLTSPQILELEKAPAVEYVSGRQNRNLEITGGDVPENVIASFQTRDTFPMLGVAPLLGRNLAPSDSPDGQEPRPVAMLNYRFWQRHFNGDPAVLGRRMELNDKEYTIVGVTEPRFGWGGLAGHLDVYLPQKLSSDLPQSSTFTIYVKLRAGVSRAAANAQLQPLMEQFAKETPANFPQVFTVDLQRLQDGTIRMLGPILSLLFAAVALLLAIGCANVSILMLARGTTRQHELAVRSAVGATGGRIVRQLLTESVMLSFAGSAVGVMLAYGAVGFIVAWLPASYFPNEADFHVNVPVLAFSVGLALFTGLVFGMFPSLQLAKPEISQIMQSGSQRVSGNMRKSRAHQTLIGGQIALTLLLLTAAGAAIEGFVRMMHVPLGYEPQNVISVSIPIHEHMHTEWTDRVNYFAKVREKIGELPEVLSTGISTNATPPMAGWETPFDLFGKAPEEEQRVRVAFIDPGYFSTLRIPLLEGRNWEQAEVMQGAALVLVNRAFAGRYFPKGDVVGHSVRVAAFTNLPDDVLAAPAIKGWMRIIGVAADAVNDGLNRPVTPEIFMPYSTVLWNQTQILVRTRTDPRPILHSIQRQVASVDPNQQAAVWQDGMLESWIREEPEWAAERLESVLFATFSVLALLLAAVGLYSVISYAVAQRRHEFGIRMALGAKREDILGSVLMSAGRAVGLGVGAGLLLSVSVKPLLSHWIENIAIGPLTIAAVTLLLLAAAALACFMPAVRAASVHPMTSLRAE